MVGGTPLTRMPPLPLWKRGQRSKPAPPGPKDPGIVKLPANGPKPDQSVDAWLYGKDLAHRKAVDINTNSNKTP